ncbi:hypothetical protein BP6252_05449 [Coleophoma cylindrospora]|uniref:HMG box domain-containing protein n=1 Tax=Coleophoma cylindrospora TaxID=1849047 RepID=A0A3D8RTV0_9HELO|nr:hypothetical protein BP6252_05449 [Coleophoma cylindrospora]
MLTEATKQLVVQTWNNLHRQFTDENQQHIAFMSAGDYIVLSQLVLNEVRQLYADYTRKAPVIARDSGCHRYIIAPSDIVKGRIVKSTKGEVIFVTDEKSIDPALDLKDATPVIHLPTLDATGKVFDPVLIPIIKGEKIKRPPNAFILYRMDHHDVVKDANPGIHNNEISTIIGAQWNTETADVRDHYQRLADEKKREHLAMYPGYHYTPRKPSEKKRRMTKKKAAALAALQASTSTPSFQLASQYPPAPLQGLRLQTDSTDVNVQLPLSDELLRQVTEHYGILRRRGAVPRGGTIITPSAQTENAQVSDAVLARRAYHKFLTTGVFDRRDIHLRAYVEAVSDPENNQHTLQDGYTVTPGAYLVSAGQ